MFIPHHLVWNNISCRGYSPANTRLSPKVGSMLGQRRWLVPDMTGWSSWSAYTILWPNAGWMLARRLRRRPNIHPALGQCIVYAGWLGWYLHLFLLITNRTLHWSSPCTQLWRIVFGGLGSPEMLLHVYTSVSLQSQGKQAICFQ